MRLPVIAGNWKMNTTLSEATALVNELRPELDRTADVDKVICPPFISLAAVRELIKGSSIKLGAQNLYFEEKGAYTGEISPLMLAGLCQFVIIGHSERRQYFSESGEITNKKIRAALQAELQPILCIGENLAEKEAGQTEQVITSELTAALSGLGDVSGLLIAYEPIWAIGSGKAASGEQANETAGFIRRSVARLCSPKVAEGIRILYGGSVTEANTAEFMQQPEIDGALVGGASLKANQFLSIVKQAAEIKKRLAG